MGRELPKPVCSVGPKLPDQARRQGVGSVVPCLSHGCAEHLRCPPTLANHFPFLPLEVVVSEVFTWPVLVVSAVGVSLPVGLLVSGLYRLWRHRRRR